MQEPTFFPVSREREMEREGGGRGGREVDSDLLPELITLPAVVLLQAASTCSRNITGRAYIL